MKKTLLLMVALASLFMLSFGHAPSSQDLVGKDAPNFTLKDLSGKEIMLSDYKGKVVVLSFFYTDCPPCKEELPILQKLHVKFAQKPLEILAINKRESKEAVEKFKKELGLTFPILLDGNQAVSGSYMVEGAPNTFIICKKGIVCKYHSGSSTEMEKILTQEIEELLK
ncbi:MAG: redoxin domain-containing protein [Candidatus Saganbacteria bacterium]|nr:redoxin domain-containing protein [Candidatus Saganbacteria bacterium]